MSSSNSDTVAGLMAKNDGSYGILIECPGGIVNPEILEGVLKISRKHNAKAHLTTSQKIMILDLDKEAGIEAISLIEQAGGTIKKTVDISQAMTCVGKPYCSFSLQETLPLAEYLYKEIARTQIPPKLKVAIAGCPACCSWANLVDVGFVGTKGGFKVLIGGHGGYKPTPGTEIGKISTPEEAANILKKVASLFIKHTPKKGRFDKVINIIGIETVKTQLGFRE